MTEGKRLELNRVGHNRRRSLQLEVFLNLLPGNRARIFQRFARRRNIDFVFQLFQEFYVLDGHHGGDSFLAAVYDNSFASILGAA